MATAYLSLGSNLGDRGKYLAGAREAIALSFPGARFSSIYETEPVDLRDQPWFLNQAAELSTELPPEALLEWLQSLENRLGRQREVPKGPRTLDLDLLLYGETVLQSPELTLPHPALLGRRHVLVPLAELSPDLSLPPAGIRVRDALGRVPDPAEVHPWKESDA